MAAEWHIPWLERTPRRGRWLVGVSGGADSVALLRILVAAGFRNLVVCHLDHRLRGRASTGDARFVGKLAEQLALTCEIGRTDVRRLMKLRGESLETAARHARHEFFAMCARKYRCRRILLAHHADDQAETVMWNLLRGSHGLKGMREEQVITVAGRPLRMLRPLLELRRAVLEEWLVRHGQRWREDASNREPLGVRNRLRHEVFPLLTEISGRDAVAAFVRGAHDSAECQQVIDAAVTAARVLDPQGRLHVPALRQLPPAVQRAAVRRFLLEHGIPASDRGLLDRALCLLDPAGPAVVNLPGGHWLRRRAGRMWIELPAG